MKIKNQSLNLSLRNVANTRYRLTSIKFLNLLSTIVLYYHFIICITVIKLSKLAYTQRAHHVESTWIRRGYYVDTSKTKFRRISTSFPRTFSMWFRWSKNPRCFTYFYQCNFDGRNMHVVFTYFFRCNFDGQRFVIDFGKL